MAISQEEVKYLGESQAVEFKNSLSLIKEACKALCGMINSDLATGLVIFGISPDSIICGIEKGNLDSAQRTIAQHIRQKFDPYIISIIEVLECGDMHLLQVRAKRMSGVPYHEYNGRAYIREGTTIRQLSYQEKQHLLKKQDRGQHNGSWQCNRCGSFVGMLVSVELIEYGMKNNYKCDCGGEYWPVT